MEIQDLKEMSKHKDVNQELLLETAHHRGFIEGIKFAKKKAIEAIEQEK